MNDTILLRFYVVAETLTSTKMEFVAKLFGLGNLLTQVPVSAELRYLVTPDEGYRYCSAERMTRLRYIMIDLEWPTEFIESDDFDAFAWDWQQVLMPDEDSYQSASDVVTWNNNAPVFNKEFTLVKYLGEFTSYEEAEAYYYNNEV